MWGVVTPATAHSALRAARWSTLHGGARRAQRAAREASRMQVKLVLVHLAALQLDRNVVDPKQAHRIMNVL
jgi:hypothetical protein